jgi:hypothetical protein
MLDVLRLVVDAGMFTLIWLVQLLIYPSFRHLSTDEFIGWHTTHGRRIGFVVVPLMIGQLGVATVQVAQELSLAHLAGMVLVLVAWTATFTLSVPCHRRLGRVGKEPATIERLIRTNWIRTAAWTGTFLFSLLAVAR